MEENEQIDKLYNGTIDFSDIMKNPIFQPLAQANIIYESQSLIIKRALFEYEENIKQIKELMKENPTYQRTIIMSKIRNVLEFSQQIIHSQDVQRESIKRCINDIVNIVGRFYENKFSQASEDKIKEVITQTSNIVGYMNEEKFEKSEEIEEELKELEETKIEKPSRKENPWLTHLTNFKKEHPKMNFKEAAKGAKDTYTPINKDIQSN